MKKVLVTGGLGFIGYHLCERLILEGIEVIAVDEYPDRKKAEQEEMELRLGRNALFTIIRGKLEKMEMGTLLKDIDVIFHLAASTSIDSKWSTLARVIDNNVNLTKKLIEASPKTARIVYPSTIEVYGERTGIITERTPTNPTTPYGITKLASESLIQKLCPKRNMSYVILRLPTVYGPWQRDDMTYQQLLLGKIPPELDRSTLDILYVDDVVEAFLLAASTMKTNEVFHLTSCLDGAWFEGLQLLGVDPELYKKRCLKTTLLAEKSENLLGFQAKTTLKEGLAKQREHVTQWQKQQRFQ
ncbi:NAD-dependent epimerase/dehydratase family protein [Halalkalibacter nanhaiisediminis]|uniref:UDP-glucose 4-epimerase n=1 Tax=Halalkalibacter nanhaiisediminis TaxID=688079 RepID=A0A562QKB3_9BACI|nr:NAD(P)-dependent oxidoreductase [Halalkalibacter nanhaiisediminis]TWI57218.1 UDP-glucose 4-epimerase [Halalkalibacter nanhaiisediminis]